MSLFVTTKKVCFGSFEKSGRKKKKYFGKNQSFVENLKMFFARVKNVSLSAENVAVFKYQLQNILRSVSGLECLITKVMESFLVGLMMFKHTYIKAELKNIAGIVENTTPGH